MNPIIRRRAHHDESTYVVVELWDGSDQMVLDMVCNDTPTAIKDITICLLIDYINSLKLNDPKMDDFIIDDVD